jgi:hypothetical protein
MVNEDQKKLLQDIKDSVYDVQKRMNKIVELLCMLVEENTDEKQAKEDFIHTLRENRISGAGGMGGTGGTGGHGGEGGSGQPGSAGERGSPGEEGGKGGEGGRGGQGGNSD